MKKLLVSVLTLALVCAAFVGCGKEEGKESVESSVQESMVESSDAVVSEELQASLPEEAETAEGFVPGIRTETEYTNESTGIKFVANESMVMATDEEIAAMMQLGMDAVAETELGSKLTDISMINTAYDMMAQDIYTGANVLVMAEKLPLEGITVAQYMDLLVKNFEMTGMASAYQDVVEEEFCGKTVANLSYTLTVENMEMSQTMLVEKLGDRMVVYSFTYFSPEQYDALVACFSAL